MNKYFKRLFQLYRYSGRYFPYIILLVLLGVCSSSLAIYKALLTKKLIDSATSMQITSMKYYLALLAIVMVVDIFIQAATSTISVRTYNNMYNFIQRNVYEHILKVKWLELSSYHSGDISTRITSDVDSITNIAVNIFPNIISFIFLLIGSFVTLLNYDVTLAVIALIISPVLILLSRIYTRKLKRLHLLLQELESKYRSFLHESLKNISIIKSFTLEGSNITSFSSFQKTRLKLKASQNNINILNTALFSSGSFITFFLVFLWGARNLSKGTATFGTMSALLQLFSNMQYPFLGLATSIPKAIAALASLDRIAELETLQSDYICFENKKTTHINNVGFEFKNINFGYKSNSPIIKNLSLNINPGETIAIIGPSGEGKTTFIRLLLSFIYPQSGDIFIKSANEKLKLDATSRNLISYVPQGNTLFSGTIADNLRCGCADASDEELIAAASITYIWDFIKELDSGLNTIIGEHGIGLSEGQAQRIAIARALLKKSPVLILDEATSSLDMNTELKVLKTIKNIKHKPTCIIITHRPSALEICDRILKLENGGLVEINNHFSEETAISCYK